MQSCRNYPQAVVHVMGASNILGAVLLAESSVDGAGTTRQPASTSDGAGPSGQLATGDRRERAQ